MLTVPESCKGGKAMGIRPRWSELLVSDSNARLGHLFALCHFRCDGGGKRSARFGEVLCRLTGKQSSTRAWRYLVDPASSHMLVSKIKPCMSKYECIYTVKLRMAH